MKGYAQPVVTAFPKVLVHFEEEFLMVRVDKSGALRVVEGGGFQGLVD